MRSGFGKRSMFAASERAMFGTLKGQWLGVQVTNTMNEGIIINEASFQGGLQPGSVLVRLYIMYLSMKTKILSLLYL